MRKYKDSDYQQWLEDTQEELMELGHKATIHDLDNSKTVLDCWKADLSPRTTADHYADDLTNPE